ncbi:MAG TPA: recombinase family protein [Solirubrobacteraceae bacterium]|nr:recombinase family protein [Solirubrobacteraceae bacterium]
MSRASLTIAPDPARNAGPVRVATYTRISTDEERQPNSLEAQRVRLDSFVSSQPEWQINLRYEDQFTGTVIDRPALSRLLRDAKRGRFDVLLVYRVDRLARSIRGLAQIVDELDQAGVVFRSATEPFDTGTPAGRMMVQMLGVFAEFERALIVERILAGLERKAARGGWCGGRRPYGYDIAADRDHLERNPTEAPLVPVIFDHYVNRQLGSSATAKWLNTNGYRTKNGRLWNHGSVLTVIRNRAYIGEIYYRGSWYPAPHESIVPRELFDRAQTILKERGEDQSQRRSNASEYLLTSRVRCGRCGQAYIGTAAHGRNGRYTYYTCFTRHRYGTEHCSNDRLPAEKLEQAVTRQLWKVLNDKTLLTAALDHAYAQLAHRDGEHEDELSSVQRKLADARAAMDRYFRAFEHGTMPENTCAPRIAALGEQTKALEARASELATLADSEPVQRISEADLDAIRQRVRAALDDGGPMRVKAILQELTDEIRIDGRDAIEPTFLVPAVRPPSGSMEPTGIEPVTSCLQNGSTVRPDWPVFPGNSYKTTPGRRPNFLLI